MKNISRRVFIKGMAVAAAATAASTVLAGCNLTPVEETPVVGFQPIANTLTIADEQVIDMTITNASTLYDENVKLEMSVSNKAKRVLTVTTNSVVTNGTALNVKVEAYFDGKYNDAVVPAAGGVDNILNTMMNPDTSADGLTSTFVYEKNLYVKAPKDWKTMTVVVTYHTSENKLKEVRYVVNK